MLHQSELDIPIIKYLLQPCTGRALIQTNRKIKLSYYYLLFLNWIKSGLMIVISNRVGDFLRFLTRLKRMLFDRRGSQTIEYVTILAAGATLAMILLSDRKSVV